MKKLISATFFVFILSCGSSNTIYDANLGQRVKVFENEDFKLFYPTNWVTFEYTPTQKNEYVYISPKKEIFEAYSFTGYANGRLDTIRGNKKYIENFENHKDQIINPSFELSYAYIYVKELDITASDLPKFIEERKIESKENKHLDIEVKKISDSFYIVQSRYQGRNRETNYKFASKVYKVYFYSTPKKTYQITYAASEYLFNKYIEDANLTFRSFELK